MLSRLIPLVALFLVSASALAAPTTQEIKDARTFAQEITQKRIAAYEAITPAGLEWTAPEGTPAFAPTQFAADFAAALQADSALEAAYTAGGGEAALAAASELYGRLYTAQLSLRAEAEKRLLANAHPRWSAAKAAFLRTEGFRRFTLGAGAVLFAVGLAHSSALQDLLTVVLLGGETLWRLGSAGAAAYRARAEILASAIQIGASNSARLLPEDALWARNAAKAMEKALEDAMEATLCARAAEGA